MKLRGKLFIPSVLMMLLLGASFIFYNNYIVSNLITVQTDTSRELTINEIEKTAWTQIDKINRDIIRVQKKAIGESTIFSGMKEVISAYELALTGNIDDEFDPVVQQARENLREAIDPIVRTYRRDTGQTDLMLHFHLPNGRSFARAWRDGWQTERDGEKVDLSDDLSGFRSTVTKINQGDHAPVKGIEVGQGGLVIRGLTAVTSSEGRHLGSNEIFFSFNKILNIIRFDELNNFAVYMKSELLSVATGMQDPEKFPLVEEKYVRTASTGSEITDPLINLKLLDKGLEAPASELTDTHYITAFPIKDFRGEAVGVIVIFRDITELIGKQNLIETTAFSTASSLRSQVIIGFLGMIAVLVLFLAILLSKVVLNPLIKCVDFSTQVANGDFTASLDIESNDELRVLSDTLNSMKTNLSGIIGKIIDSSSTLFSLSSSLSTSASQLSSGSERSSDNADSVAAASEEMSTNMNSIAAASEEASTNIKDVSLSVGEMNLSSNDSMQKAEEAGRIVDDTVESVRNSSGTISELGLAANKIGDISNVISDFSDQIDLLALNARIEAARAGEAGKGFAVVANEIKDLAKQTADATLEIDDKIRNIQNATNKSSTENNHIMEAVILIKDVVAALRESIEKQTATMGTISLNMNQASLGIEEVNINVNQSSTVAAEIARDISSVSQNTGEMKQSSFDIKENSLKLLDLAKKLEVIINDFKLE